MGHFIQAFIGARHSLEKIKQDYGASEVFDLKQGLSILPLIDPLYDSIPDEEDTNLIDERFQFLTPKIVKLLAEHSSNTSTGYIETDYFGGQGSQGAILARAGKIIYGPKIGDGSINEALKLMGIQKASSLDEFDTVELGRFRSNEDFVVKTLDTLKLTKAVQILRDCSDVPYKEAVEHLVQAVGDKEMGEKLMEFLPLAYARIGFSNSGVKFDDRFCRSVGNGKFSHFCPLEAEPIWNEVVAFAKKEIEQGMPIEIWQPVAEWSALFDAINKACLNKTSLQGAVMSPTFFLRSASMPLPPLRKWWQFWK